MEVLVENLAGIFAALAILISCLGLFGLAAYMAEQRTKEVGIRKVLGASVSQLWLMLSKEFIVLVLISSLIASPVALYFLQDWLQKYQYRISIGLPVFIVAAVAATIITVVTISFQTIKAAIGNPATALRNE
jgi:ABC-type antimicrobial peptide transport system permease subunit